MFPFRDHNPTGRIPYVTYGLIAVNVLIFLATWHLESNQRALFNFYADYALVPMFLSDGYGYSGLVTSMFLHGGLMHLAGNMLFLYIYGDNMEDEMGHWGFALFYLMSGIGAGLIHYITGPNSNVPLIGASGAIAGVMGGYLLLFPKARIDIFLFLVIYFRIFTLPAWIVLMVWFGMQLFGGADTSANEGGVAYWAHIGGFAVGLVLTLPLWLWLGATAFWRRTDGHPPYPETKYKTGTHGFPRIPRNR
ncbi:MAG: rhomboid family intramembrane serine protease [Pelagimonas sp.]|jgi:membrane associated rhomboid family serine protease|nr:rhomboid family intramembrane serine protease [Pelagimonas sp.]